MSLTYKDSGVDVSAGDALVERIKQHTRRTQGPQVLAGVGGFASLFALGKYEDPVLVSGTDGVGTKLKLAFTADRHDTIGIDLVAMCVNDILTTGAQPLFFLDYFATGSLRLEVAEAVIAGIARGCEESGCALVGGETAEMPGMYAEGEYDLAGFAVGVVERSAIVDGTTVVAGDAVIGIASSGIHSNGYSLVRRALSESEQTQCMDDLLRPTALYAKAIAAVSESVPPKAMAHITGGGIVGNLPRVLPDGLGARLSSDQWSCPEIFQRVQKAGGIETAEMYRTFNMGLGMCVVVPADQVDAALSALKTAGQSAQHVGEIVASDGADDRVHIA